MPCIKMCADAKHIPVFRGGLLTESGAEESIARQHPPPPVRRNELDEEVRDASAEGEQSTGEHGNSA